MRLFSGYGWTSAALSPDGHTIAKNAPVDFTELLDAESGNLKRMLQTGVFLGTCSAFSPDGRTFAKGLSNTQWGEYVKMWVV